MVRIIIAVIVGFLAWSIMWVGSEQVLSSVFPDWFGKHQTDFERAVFNKETYTVDSGILIFNIFRGIVVSIITGFLTAVIAGENRKSTLILGVLLLAFGLYIVAVTWAMIPIWYHVLFSLMLIPMTMLGGRLKSSAAS